MAHYSYKARSKKGQPVDGIVEATDRAIAVRTVEELGHIPVSVEEVTKTATRNSEGKKKRFHLDRGFQRKPKMKLNDLLLFSRELSDLVASGMTIGRALHTLSPHKGEGSSHRIIAQLRDEIVQGASLSDALESYPETFSSLYINLVRAGEASGTLPIALENVCIHYERVQDARNKISSALVYPFIVLIFGGLAVVFLMVFIVPQFVNTFDQMGATLPKPTLALMRASNFMVHYGLLLAAMIVGLSILTRRWVKSPTGKRIWHRYQLKIPIMGAVVTTNAFAHFARTFGTLLQNGVSVLPALGIVQKTINNVVISEEIGMARERVTDGSSISKPLSKSKVFPSLLTDMLAVGEETGDMTGSLSHITRRYDTELDRLVKTCTTALEPLLIVMVALIVGGIALCLLLPVLTLTDSLHI